MESIWERIDRITDRKYKQSESALEDLLIRSLPGKPGSGATLGGFARDLIAAVKWPIPIRLTAAVVLLGTVLCGVVTAYSQESQVAVRATRQLDVAEIEARLAAVEADATLDEELKTVLRSRFKQAIETSNKAADHAASEVAFREIVETGSTQIEGLERELASLPSLTDVELDTAGKTIEDLQNQLEAQRLAASQLREQREKISSEIPALQDRPDEIGTRLPEARRQLTDGQQKLKAIPEIESASQGEIAKRVLLESEQSMLVNEIGMLEQELLSQSVRENLLRARNGLVTRQVENAEAGLSLTKTAVNNALEAEAKRAISEASKDVEREGGGALDELVTETKELASQFEGVVNSLKDSFERQGELSASIDSLNSRFVVVKGLLELGDSGASMARVLVKLRYSLPGDWELDRDMDSVDTKLIDARLAAIRIKDDRLHQRELEQMFPSPRSSTVDELLARRVDLLGKLETQTGVLIRDQSMLKGKQRIYADKVREVRQLLNESLFWMRSSSPINMETAKELPGALSWLFGTQGVGLIGGSIAQQAARLLVPTVLIAIVVAALMIMRPRLRRSLAETEVKIRRISTDRYSYTLRALGDTLLLSLPVPLLIGFAGSLLLQDPAREAWHMSVGIVLQLVALAILPLWFTAEVCRKHGLGNAHFGWPQEGLSRIRRSYLGFIAAYPPAIFITVTSFFANDGEYFDSLGRVSFMLVHLFLAVGVWGLLCSKRGALAPIANENPNNYIISSQKYWIPIVVACPIALVAAAASGYLRAAFNLSLELLTTVVIVSLGVLAYQLVLRWFTIRERKHALAEALEKRRSRQEPVASDGEEADTGDAIVVDFEEDELDLRSSGQQTRHLLSFLFATGTAFAIVIFWSKTIPALASLHTIRPLFGLSLSQLGQLALIIAIMTIAVKNLPGLLELATLRRTSMSGGTRHAVSTLCQYAAVAIGLAAVVDVLEVDWAQFGWIAAALSVGLGFGLQEVVANFVCGLILLFERPIRVGDIVTLDGITGKVTKIRIRATSVTDWDQKEFVVPNKSIITGTLMNWTLTSPISRIVFTVGVAYGSDTEQARQILAEVASAHPLILDDPAPSTSFEEFADSSLTLRLRAFLPDPENRVRTITELHTEIDKRFAAAGIEIPFPQRDLNLRGGWPSPPSDTE